MFGPTAIIGKRVNTAEDGGAALLGQVVDAGRGI